MADMLVTRAELASWLQLPAPGVDNATADRVIAAATAEVQSAAGQRLVEVSGDVITLLAEYGPWLSLPEAPVTEVTTVVVGSTTVTDYTLVSDPVTARARLWRSYGWQNFADVLVSYATPPLVTVTYDHGYAVGDQRLELARSYVFRLAAFSYPNPTGAESEAIDDYRITFGDTEPLRSLSTADRLEIRRAYGPTAGSARLQAAGY